MSGHGEQAWSCARTMLGVRFRLQGRSPENGLDCVGLVIAAYSGAGIPLRAIDDYALRGFPKEQALAAMDSAGFERVDDRVRAGDVALFALPARQLHFALLAPDQLIHADAALRRVAAAPLTRLPPAMARWRCTMKG